MKKQKLILSIAGITSLSNLYAAGNTSIIKDKVILETNPDVLISKDILRSEILNEMEYKLKLRNFLRSQKEEELKYKKLTLEEYKLQLDKEKIKLEEKKLYKENTSLDFEIAKIKKRMEYLNEFPYTTLKFKPNKLDLIKNILKANQEAAKRRNVRLLKTINQKNLITLKKQYIILQKFEYNFNQLYFNLVNRNYKKALEYYKKINTLSTMLLETNILYMQKEFSKFRIEILKLNTFLRELIAAKEDKNLDLEKEKYKQTIDQYQTIVELYYSIRNSLLKKIISLQQINQNEFKILEIIQKDTNLKLEKINPIAPKKKKVNTKITTPRNVEVNVQLKREQIIRRLAIELGVPTSYLKFLTPADIAKIEVLNNKIQFYKSMLLQIENNNVDIKKLKEIARVLGCDTKNPDKLYIQNKLINEISVLVKEKYLIVDRAIRKYKEEKAKEEAKLRKLKELERKKKLLELKRKKLQEAIRKKQLEEERKRREMERIKREKEERLKRLKLQKIQKERKIKQEFQNTMRKFKYIGLINNYLVIKSKVTGNMVYLKPGTTISHYKVISVDINTGDVVFKDMLNNRKFTYNFITPNTNSEQVSANTSNDTGDNLFDFNF